LKFALAQDAAALAMALRALDLAAGKEQFDPRVTLQIFLGAEIAPGGNANHIVLVAQSSYRLTSAGRQVGTIWSGGGDRHPLGLLDYLFTKVVDLTHTSGTNHRQNHHEALERF
jgi:hypothetical protein